LAIDKSFEIVYNQIKVNDHSSERIRTMAKKTLEEKARERVNKSPRLSKHADTILYDWPEEDEHWAWVVKAPVSEIVGWAETVEAAGE